MQLGFYYSSWQQVFFVIKRWQAKLLSWSIHCALLSCPDRDLDLPVNKSRSNLNLRLYSHVYWIFILIKSYISGCFPHMPECPLEKKTQIKFKRIHIICSRKTFLSKNFEIYTVFSSFDDSNISVWCPSFANVFSPCQENFIISAQSQWWTRCWQKLWGQTVTEQH